MNRGTASNLLFTVLMLIPVAALSFGGFGSSNLSCSVSSGKAVINEVQTASNFVEIFLLQSANISGWTLYNGSTLIATLGTGSCTINGTTTADNANNVTTFPAGTFVYCSYNFNASSGEVVLADSNLNNYYNYFNWYNWTSFQNGGVIDYLRYGNGSSVWSVPNSCSTLYYSHSGGNTDIARIPDGTGSLTDNGSNSTPGCTNYGICSFTKTASNTAPMVGSNVVYTISAKSSNPSNVSNVSVYDILPAGLSYVSSTATQGSYSSSTGKWTIGTVSAGATVSLTLTATQTQAGAVTNTANLYINNVLVGNSAAIVTNAISSTGAPSNFNCVVTGGNATTGSLYTQLVGTPFSFDVLALNSSGSVLTAYASTGNKNVTVELVDGSSAASCASRASLSPAVSQILTFAPTNQGRKASSSFTVGNAYSNILCRVTDANQSPSVVGCSTDNFAVRPTGFTVTSSGATADSGGSSYTATPVIKTGAAFNLTATALTGYSGTPLIDNTKLTGQSGAIQSGSLGGSFGTANSATGVATANSFTYSEVGYFALAANGVYDNTFTAVDSADGDCITSSFSNTAVNGQYGCNFGNTAITNYFGRFIPDHLDVTLNTPVFAPACVTLANNAVTNGFTYIGQPIQYATNPVATVTAKNASATVTRNYTGNYFKISPGSSSYGISPGYTEASQSLTVLNSAVPTVTDQGKSNSSNSGIGTLTFADTTSNILGITRPASPINSFSANIALSFTLKDTDGIAVANVNGSAIGNANSIVSFGAASPGNGISFTGGFNTVGWGRLAMSNAGSSELTALTVPLFVQYLNSNAFVTNTNDNCTAISLASQIGLNNPGTGNGTSQAGTATMTVGSGTSTASLKSAAMANGSNGIVFSAPGAGNTGYIIITSNIGGSYPWLLYTWNQSVTPVITSPSAVAAFGVYQGNPKAIYFREMY